jgi:hypothetical protein
LGEPLLSCPKLQGAADRSPKWKTRGQQERTQDPQHQSTSPSPDPPPLSLRKEHHPHVQGARRGKWNECPAGCRHQPCCVYVQLEAMTSSGTPVLSFSPCHLCLSAPTSRCDSPLTLLLCFCALLTALAVSGDRPGPLCT